MYVITRKDLDPGYQAVQSIHAFQEFVMEHRETNENWYYKSNYLGLLSVNNQYELMELFDQAKNLGIKCSMFREPDIDNEVTAIALEPGEKSKKLCARHKLALIEYKK